VCEILLLQIEINTLKERNKMKRRRKKISAMKPPTGRFIQAEVSSICESEGLNFFDDRISVKFRIENYADVEHEFPVYSSDDIDFAKLVDCTLGRSEQETTIRLQDLVGLKCGIKVEYMLRNGRLILEVVDICSLDELAEKQVVLLAK
jgi:hypothetical protein